MTPLPPDRPRGAAGATVRATVLGAIGHPVCGRLPRCGVEEQDQLHLFVDLDPASVARLTLTCDSKEEFNSFMSALADVLGQVAKPSACGAPQARSSRSVTGSSPQLDADAGDRVATAFGTLIRLRHIRVGTKHADARHKAVGAFREIGLGVPFPSWEHAWTHIAVVGEARWTRCARRSARGCDSPSSSPSPGLGLDEVSYEIGLGQSALSCADPMCSICRDPFRGLLPSSRS